METGSSRVVLTKAQGRMPMAVWIHPAPFTEWQATLAGSGYPRARGLRIVIVGVRTVTTMALGNDGFGFTAQARWRATLLHGGILAALVAGVVALWSVLALVVALLVHPLPTMTTLERDGARGVPTVVRHGTATVVAGMRDGLATRRAR